MMLKRKSYIFGNTVDWWEKTMRKAYKIIAAAAAIIALVILIIVIYVNTYPYAVAESSDGNWKAAVISDKEFK